MLVLYNTHRAGERGRARRSIRARRLKVSSVRTAVWRNHMPCWRANTCVCWCVFGHVDWCRTYPAAGEGEGAQSIGVPSHTQVTNFMPPIKAQQVPWREKERERAIGLGRGGEGWGSRPAGELLLLLVGRRRNVLFGRATIYKSPFYAASNWKGVVKSASVVKFCRSESNVVEYWQP